MNRFPSCPSRSARRSAEIWTVRLAGSTKTLGQTRAINSCLLTNSPGRSSKTIRISRARLPRGTGLSPSSRRNCVGSRRNGPNETSVGAARTGFGSFLEEWPVRIRTLTARLASSLRFGTKLRQRCRLGRGKRSKAVVDPDTSMVTSRALRGPFPRSREVQSDDFVCRIYCPGETQVSLVAADLSDA